jgi:glycosyltransferase involved in cell wall biosynthesis
VVVPPEDPAALAQAFEELVADPMRVRALGGRGREVVLHRFDRRQVVEQWRRLLERVSG